MSFLSTTAGVGVIDTRSRQGTITLPLTSQIVNRYIQFKDLYGAFGRSSLTVSTQGGESFDDGTTSKIFTDPYTFFTLYAASTTKWAQLGGTQTIQQTVSSLIVSSLTIGTGYGWLQLPPIQTIAVSTNTVTTDSVVANSTTSFYMSAQVLYVSSIIGPVLGAGNLTTSNLTSTVAGLGQIYLSTGGGATAASLTSTVQGLATAGYLSSVSGATGFVSSLTVNALTLGTGAGWLQLPPIQTVYSSTIYTQAQALFALSTYLGGTSTLTTIDFYGLFGNYNNTVLAEVSTGGGTQELLMFKGSSASDRVRIQTTGNFVVETGVSARLWSDSTVPTLSNVTPAFIVNTSSNVGIQTASPGATLDVAGTGRFQILSTQNINLSTINGQAFGGPITSTVIGLGTAGYVSTSQLVSTSFGLADHLEVQSTSRGLGTLGYVSTSQLVSTTVGLVDHLELQSTSRGLGTLGYLSSFVIGGSISTNAIFTSSMTASSILTSSLQVNSLIIGTGTGWVNIGPIQTVAVSSIQTNANALYATTSYFGTVSSATALQFNGLLGNYNNSVVAEVSTGTGTQELLMFKGSSASDRVRIQTTGNFVVETGVSARLWNPNTTQTPSNATPAFLININSNVGIQTSNPTAPLDVAGTIRAITLSSQTAVVSSIVSLNLSSLQGSVSSLTVNSLQVGDGLGWVNMGPIQTVALSTIQGNANTNTTILTSTLALNVSSIVGVASPFVSQGRLTANQNITANTNDVMIQFVSDFDPNGWLQNAGTSTARVLPRIAGYYSATLTVWWATGTGTNQVNIQIRKTGQTIAIAQNQVNTVNGLTMNLTKIAFMNGTSDYFEFPAFTGTSGGSQAVQFGGSALSPGTYYSVNLIR
jgi:hypothetical protein